MQNLMISYLPILLFLFIAGGLGLIMVVLPFLVSRGSKNINKSSQYECGFAPFSDARVPFDIRFYLVSILFIIFDLEIVFLFPWAIVLKQLPTVGFWSMMIFLSILAVGFIYEWRKGALNWK
jgi:NADH-quinone oxidoreductase subunit A